MGLGDVSKLFSALPDGVSVGNPTFSKNSPYIIGFDYIESGNLAVLGYNLETSEDGLIRAQQGLGYPSFSRTDEQVVYDDTSNGALAGIGISDLDDSKIVAGNPGNLSSDFRWPVWFGNGDRTTSLEELESQLAELSIYPNPTSGNLTLSFDGVKKGSLNVEVFTLLGKKVYGNMEQVIGGAQEVTLHLSRTLPNGSYIVKLSSEDSTGSSTIQLMR